MNNDLLNVQGTPMPLDATLNKAYIDALKQHVELLEAKKREILEIITSRGMNTQYTNGVIAGLDFAINQLNNDINYVKLDGNQRTKS